MVTPPPVKERGRGWGILILLMKSFLLFKYYQLLGRLARRYLAKRKPLIIGINGSVGKTSCRMIIDDILQANLWDQLSIYTSPKNFNGELGMSLSIFKIESRTPSVSGMISTLQTIRKQLKSPQKPYDILILEYGIDRPLEMEFLCSIAKPHISVLTKLDAVHSLQFGTAEDIANEELKLQKNTLLKCYINTSDQHGMTLAPSLKTEITSYHTWVSREATVTPLLSRRGDGGEAYSFNYTIYNNNHNESSLTAPICSQSILHFGKVEIPFQTDSIGQIHHSYVALAYDITETVRNQYNLKPIDLKHAVSLHLQAGRMSIFEGIHDSIIVDSTYNSSPLSVRKVIEESLVLQKQLFPDRPCLYILGEMRELWDSETQHHLELADYLSTKLQPHDQVILLWKAMTHTFEKINNSQLAISSRISHFLDRHDVATKANEIVSSPATGRPERSTLGVGQGGRFIIAKGSQNTIFLEEVVKSLLAHPEDANKLTRQGSFWEGKKR